MPAIKHDDMLLRLVKDVNEVRSVLRRVVANLPLFDIDNENTPAQLTADQNNYVPGNYDVLRLSGDAARNITGIRNGTKGRRLRIFNVGNYPITLVHASLSSLAGNRFNFVNSSDFIIPPSGNVLLYYDATQSRWIGGDQASIYDVLNETTPAQITADQNNYDPEVAEIMRISSNAARSITGISGGVKGRRLQMFNVGSYAITLVHESASSTAANRFKFSSGVNATIPAGSNISLYYDSTQSRWIEGFQLEDSGISKEDTLAQITADQNNYDPGDYNVVRISSNAARSITGISGGVKGRRLQMFNVGSYAITLVYESTSSTAANRFKFSSGQNCVIPPGGNVALYYDSTQSRWVGSDLQSSGAVYMEVHKASAQSVADGGEKIDPGTVVSDQYGFYDDANNQIVIPFGGAYQITFLAECDTAAADFALVMNKNSLFMSSAYGLMNPHGSDEFHFIQAQYTAIFDTGDEIEFYAIHNYGSSRYISNVTVTLVKVN